MDGDPPPADGSSRRLDAREAKSSDPLPGQGEALGRLDAVDADLAALGETVRQLAGVVARLAQESRPDPATANGPVSDDDPGEELARWVRWLVRTYELDAVPECWAEHGAYVGELDALRVGWLATIGRGASGLEAMQWHDLAGRAFERLKGLYRTCTDGTHRGWTAPEWADDSR